jgi:NADH-quinone oxidoreductase subunit J
MVLFLFVIALMGNQPERPEQRLRFQSILALLVLAVLAGLLYNWARGIAYAASEPSVDVAIFGTVQDIALGLFTRYLYPFELTSLILLVAAIGAIYLSRRETR